MFFIPGFVTKFHFPELIVDASKLSFFCTCFKYENTAKIPVFLIKNKKISIFLVIFYKKTIFYHGNFIINYSMP